MGDERKLVIPVECFSRVCGYYRPTSCWNVGKKQEFKDRKYYDKKLIDVVNNENGGT